MYRSLDTKVNLATGHIASMLQSLSEKAKTQSEEAKVCLTAEETQKVQSLIEKVSAASKAVVSDEAGSAEMYADISNALLESHDCALDSMKRLLATADQKSCDVL